MRENFFSPLLSFSKSFFDYLINIKIQKFVLLVILYNRYLNYKILKNDLELMNPVANADTDKN